MSRRIRTLLVGLAAALPLAPASRAQLAPLSLDSVFVYSVEVACTTRQIPIGIVTSVSAAGELRAGAQEELSRTRVDLFNPLEQSVAFTYRAVQPRTGAAGGATFAPVSESLDGFAARSLDCGDFLALQQSAAASAALPATEGFLVIESRSRLRVAAVYTQRVVKEGLKDDVSAAALLAGKKNVFRGGDVPDLEEIPLIPIPGGSDSTGSARSAWGEPGKGGAHAETPPGAAVGRLARAGGVAIPIQQYGKGPVQAAGTGIGLGFGVGRGIGLGIGAGGGIDVEYVEPIVVPRRLTTTGRSPGSGGG